MSLLRKICVSAIEGALRLNSRRCHRQKPGLALQHFGEGGLETAEKLCKQAANDPAALLRVPGRVEPRGQVEIERLSETAKVTIDHIQFDSPEPTGCPRNDRVHMRLITPKTGGPHRNVALFHHSIGHDSWGMWTWFNSLISKHIPVAIVAAPHHFDRRRPGEFGGQRSACANPWRLFEAGRQWAWDQAAAQTLLRERVGLEPSASIGFSFGSFQMLMTAVAGCLEMPLVAIAPTNDYGWAITRGWIGTEVRRQLREVGIDEKRFLEMARPVRLHPVVGELRGRPILVVEGAYDRVDPPPSIERLTSALRPSHHVVLPAGHGTLLMFRRRISAAVLDFFADARVLEPAARSADYFASANRSTASSCSGVSIESGRS